MFLLASMCPSCVHTIEPMYLETKVDTAEYRKPHKPHPPRDTTEVSDTARVPIGWNPSVEDWEETDIDL